MEDWLTVQRVAELMSLGMTFPTILLAASVVYVWGSSVRFPPTSSHQYFITGVVIGFIGSLMDNLYWGFPWTVSFMRDYFAVGDGSIPLLDRLFNLGVYFNIIFRQGCGIAAAYCHLKAAKLTPATGAYSDTRFKWVNYAIATSCIAGLFFALWLVYLHM